MCPEKDTEETIPPDALNRKAVSAPPETVGKGPRPVGMEGPDEVEREPERDASGAWVAEGEPGREWGPEMEPDDVEQATRRRPADEG